jgi:hypothetical protein
MKTTVDSETLRITSGSSQVAPNHGLIITVKDWSSSTATITYGSAGSINANKSFELGDAALYETSNHGIVEIRLMSIKSGVAEVLLTVVSPRLGFSTSINSNDEGNRFFTDEELLHIKDDIEKIKTKLSDSGSFSPEQQQFLSVKLSEIVEASQRLGRKDWIMYVNGTLTSVITNAAFNPIAAQTLIAAFNNNLDWVFQNLIRLIGH